MVGAIGCRGGSTGGVAMPSGTPGWLDATAMGVADAGGGELCSGVNDCLATGGGA